MSNVTVKTISRYTTKFETPISNMFDAARRFSERNNVPFTYFPEMEFGDDLTMSGIVTSKGKNEYEIVITPIAVMFYESLDGVKGLPENITGPPKVNAVLISIDYNDGYVKPEQVVPLVKKYEPRDLEPLGPAQGQITRVTCRLSTKEAAHAFIEDMCALEQAPLPTVEGKSDVTAAPESGDSGAGSAAGGDDDAGGSSS